MAKNQDAASAPIILVPGFWLGAWAWDEVGAMLRADGHDVTALTLPGLESADADRSAVTLADHVDAIVDAVEAADAPVVLAVHSADRLLGLRRERSRPGADRGDGLRRHRSRRSARSTRVRWASRSRWSGPSRGGGEPRRAERRAAGDVPPASRARAGRSAPRRHDVHERRPARHPEHAHLHWLHGRGLPDRTRRTIPTGRFWPASPSCATPPGSTCRRATGRCGRARRSSSRIIGDVAKAHAGRAATTA